MAKYDPSKTPDAIRKLREKGMSCEQIAKRLKISRDTLTSWKEAYPDVAKILAEKIDPASRIYDPKFHPGYARELRLEGLTSEQIADKMGIGITTFDEWREKHAEFAEAINTSNDALSGLLGMEMVRAILKPREVLEEERVYGMVPNPKWTTKNDEPKMIEGLIRRVERRKVVVPTTAEILKAMAAVNPKKYANLAKSDEGGGATPKESPLSDEEREVKARLSRFPKKFHYIFNRIKTEQPEMFERFVRTGDIEEIVRHINQSSLGAEIAPDAKPA